MVFFLRSSFWPYVPISRYAYIPHLYSQPIRSTDNSRHGGGFLARAKVVLVAGYGSGYGRAVAGSISPRAGPSTTGGHSVTYRLYRNRKVIRVDGAGNYGYSYWSIFTEQDIMGWRSGQWSNGAKDGVKSCLLEICLLTPEIEI